MALLGRLLNMIYQTLREATAFQIEFGKSSGLNFALFL